MLLKDFFLCGICIAMKFFIGNFQIGLVESVPFRNDPTQNRYIPVCAKSYPLTDSIDILAKFK
jgi:hypothetical protein